MNNLDIGIVPSKVGLDRYVYYPGMASVDVANSKGITAKRRVA